MREYQKARENWQGGKRTAIVEYTLEDDLCRTYPTLLFSLIPTLVPTFSHFQPTNDRSELEGIGRISTMTVDILWQGRCLDSLHLQDGRCTPTPVPESSNCTRTDSNKSRPYSCARSRTDSMNTRSNIDSSSIFLKMKLAGGGRLYLC